VDPDATLDRIRVLTANLIESAYDEPEPTHIAELAGLVDALDAWITYRVETARIE